MSEHLAFTRYASSESGKTGRYEVRSKHDGGLLALVSWYGPWRRYVVHPQDGTLYDASCLRDIADFLDAEKAKVGR